jgi:predicted component of type VI protein secretion system
MSAPLFKLVSPSGDVSPRLLDSGRYRIGTADDADLKVAGDDVAAEHCSLIVGPGGVQLSIARGCRVEVNQRPVDGVIALRANDTLAIGRTRLRLLQQADAAAVGPRLAQPAESRDVLSTTVRPVLPRFVLKGVSGAMLGRSVPLHATTTVGRAGECDLLLELDSISRVHARLTPSDDSVLVEDMGSANGTWLNGRRVLREQAVHGDEIRFDAQRFQLLLPGQPLPANDETLQPQPRTRWPLWLAALAVLGTAGFMLLR